MDLEEGGEAAGAGGHFKHARAGAIARTAGHECAQGHQRLAPQEEGLRRHLVHACAALRQPTIRLPAAPNMLQLIAESCLTRVETVDPYVNSMFMQPEQHDMHSMHSTYNCDQATLEQLSVTSFKVINRS
jgi:hypothetical protein